MTYLGAPKYQGMGLLDLLLVLVIASLLAAVAVPAYDQFIDRTKVSRAVDDLGTISLVIVRFRVENNDHLPASLSELPIEIPLDPWGAPYQYLNIVAAGPGNGNFRKHGRLIPLNSDFDLYSMGADGESKGPLSARSSRDDIVRANSGGFIGLATEY